MAARDDYKFSIGRTVGYFRGDADREAGCMSAGIITDVKPEDEQSVNWVYTIRDAATDEEELVPEECISDGARLGYLDLRRRDGIQWVISPPESAESDAADDFWKRSLSQFMRTAVHRIWVQESRLERERAEGRELALASGDYIKVRGDLRAEAEPYHNLYARVLSVTPAEASHVEVPHGKHGVAPGMHRLLNSYHVRLDNGEEADIYDVEVGVVYTTHGRTVILNRRAASFLAEAFGDSPPYDVEMELLESRIFSRADLEGVSRADLADLLARFLYAKGLIPMDDAQRRARSLGRVPREVLVDYILAVSRFDMHANRQMDAEEIERRRTKAADSGQ